MPPSRSLSSLRILIAPDKFKGSLTAQQAVEAISMGFERSLPDVRLHKLPLADGGEGTAALFIKAFGGQMVDCETTDALGRPTKASYAWMPSMRQAVIEMSAASGLAQLKAEDHNPLRTNTVGTGTLMIDAARRGAQRILIGLGGSATNDGGVGVASALGYLFLDREGNPLAPIPENFARIDSIAKSPRIFTPEVIAISDVRNPLLGPQGASHIYGPQKGASASDVERLDQGLTHLANIVTRDLHCDFRDTAGAGAAGGLGYGLLSFAHATLRPGFETFADMMDLDRLISGVDLVVTGEGMLDPQTLDGKGPGGIALRAKKYGKPVIAFAGAMKGEHHLEDYFDVCFSLANGPMSVEQSVREARSLLVRAAEKAGRMIAFSRNL